MNNTRKQIIEIIKPYMDKSLAEMTYLKHYKSPYLYTEQEEKDLLELLIKLKNE